MFEIEMKFKVDDVEQYRRQLRDQFGVEFGAVREESDLFFQHNERDFRETDECLRLRVSSRGMFVTYKGPKLDSQTKTREEIELPVEACVLREETVLQWRTLFERLGFKAVAQVVKKRSSVSLDCNGMDYDVTLDEVPELGFFTEWETSCCSESELDEKRSSLLKLVSQFNLGISIRKSYLELISGSATEYNG